MIRVAFWTPTGEIGGAENSLLLLLGGLDKEVITPIVICGSSGPLESRLSRLRVRCKVVQPPDRFLRLSRAGRFEPLAMIDAIKLVKDVTALISREGIDLLYTNGIKLHILGCFVAKLSGCGLVWHFRDVLAVGQLRALMQLLARWFPHRIIACSDAVAKQFVRPGGAAAKVQVAYNGVDLDEFHAGPPVKRRICDIDLNRFDHIVGTFGMLVPLKGHRYFIEAADIVLRKFPKTLFLIVGDEIYQTANRGHRNHTRVLRDIVQKKGIAGNVLFTGYRNDVPHLMRFCDVIVLSSVHPEACPRTVLEAMACGKPVVGTALGGTCELIEDGQSGRLVRERDSSLLAEVISELLADNSSREIMGRRARLRAQQLFSARSHCTQIQSILLSTNNEIL